MGYSGFRLSELKRLLKALAEKHALQIKKKETRNFANNVYIKPEIRVILEGFFQKYSKEFPKETSISLERILSDVLKSREELSQLGNNNNLLYVTACNSLFASFEPKVHIPITYDLLLEILQITSEVDRQRYFTDLRDYYYLYLQKILEQYELNLNEVLPKKLYEHQVSNFLFHAKLDTIYFCKHSPLEWKSTQLKDIFINLVENLKYPLLSREDCYEIIKNSTNTTDYKFIKYELNKYEEVPGNMGDYFKLQINIVQNSIEKILHFFVKTLPSGEGFKAIAKVSLSKEEFVYQYFFPTLKKFGYDNLLDFAPKCHFSKHNQLIVLDDLSVTNYSSSVPRIPAEYEYLKHAIKLLTKFQTCSIVFEEYRSRAFGKPYRMDEEFAEHLRETHFSDTDSSGDVMKCGGRTLHCIIQQFPEVPKTMTMKEFKEKAKSEYEKLFRDLKASAKYRNVICHGDMWVNNIMVRRNSEGNISSCYLVDYQLVRYCPPVIDLLFLIYATTEKKTRDLHYDDLHNVYYQELTSCLVRFDINVNKIFDYETFLNSSRDYRTLALCQAIAYNQIVLLPNLEKLKADAEKSKEFFLVERATFYEEENVWNDRVFNSRMKEYIEELYECIQDR